MCQSIGNDSLWQTGASEIVYFDVSCEDCVVELYTETEESLVCYLSGWVARKSGISRKCQIILTKPVLEHSYSCRPEDVFNC